MVNKHSLFVPSPSNIPTITMITRIVKQYPYKDLKDNEIIASLWGQPGYYKVDVRSILMIMTSDFMYPYHSFWEDVISFCNNPENKKLIEAKHQYPLISLNDEELKQVTQIIQDK